MASADSRLDRLAALLHSGASEAVRLTAARQLGAIQREHPEQLHALLHRILRYLFNERWETRWAAAQALEAVSAAVPPWQPAHVTEADTAAEAAARAEAAGAWLGFETFDMGQVLSCGTPLLASGGQEFEVERGNETARERLLRQKVLLQEQLGLDTIADVIGGREQREMMDLIEEDDVSEGQGRSAPPQRRGIGEARRGKADSAHSSKAEALSRQLAESGAALSERARNSLKRQAAEAARRLESGSDVSAVALPRAGTGPPAKRMRSEGEAEDGGTRGERGGDDAGEGVAAGEGAAEGDGGEGQWPFEPLCAELRCSLFHPRWQRRHGATLGLRAVLKAHAVRDLAPNLMTPDEL